MTARRGGAVLPVVAGVLVLVGGTVGAPEAGLAASGLAAVAALVSFRGAARRGRVVAALLLALPAPARADCGSDCASSCGNSTGKDYEECMLGCLKGCLKDDPPAVPAPSPPKPVEPAEQPKK